MLRRCRKIKNDKNKKKLTVQEVNRRKGGAKEREKRRTRMQIIILQNAISMQT